MTIKLFLEGFEAQLASDELQSVMKSFVKGLANKTSNQLQLYHTDYRWVDRVDVNSLSDWYTVLCECAVILNTFYWKPQLLNSVLPPPFMCISMCHIHPPKFLDNSDTVASRFLHIAYAAWTGS